MGNTNLMVKVLKKAWEISCVSKLYSEQTVSEVVVPIRLFLGNNSVAKEKDTAYKQ
jgi:hypothetical protein